MNTNGKMAPLYRVMEWIMQLAYLQFLWTVTSLLGGVALGLFPATSAMFTVVRKWIRGESDFSIFPIFWKQYKLDFVKANILGWIMVIIGFGLYFYYGFIQGLDGMISSLGLVVIVMFTIIYCMTFLFLFPVSTHYHLPIFQVLKHSMLLAIANPIHVIIMGACIALLIYVTKVLPEIIFILSFSSIAFALMWIALLAFARIDKKAKLNQ